RMRRLSHARRRVVNDTGQIDRNERKLRRTGLDGTRASRYGRITRTPEPECPEVAQEVVAMPVPVMKGFARLSELPEQRIGDKITRRILVGEKEMVVFWKMKAGAHATMHQHPHEQIFWMLSGKMEFT